MEILFGGLKSGLESIHEQVTARKTEDERQRTDLLGAQALSSVICLSSNR